MIINVGCGSKILVYRKGKVFIPVSGIDSAVCSTGTSTATDSTDNIKRLQDEMIHPLILVSPFML